MDAIDGLRAVSVLAVLIGHLDATLLPGGFVGVDVFFVISGFVVTRSLLNAPAETSLLAYLSRFYRRRALRILPALLLFLVVVGTLSTLLIPERDYIAENAKVGLSAIFGLSNVMLWATSENYFAAAAEYNPYTHTWSLGVEEQFYVLFPIVLFLLTLTATRRPVSLLVAVLSVLSLGLCAYMSSRSPTFAFFMLPARFWELGAGALAALMLAAPAAARADARPAWRFGAAAATPLIAFALALLGVGFAFADPAAFPFPWALAPVTGAVIICATVSAAPGSPLARALAWRPLVWIGLLSYSLYLWHFGVFVLLRWTVGMETVAMQVGAVALSFGLAWASYRFVEQPLRKGARVALAPDWKVLGGALASVVLALGLLGGIFASRPWLTLSVTGDTDAWTVFAPDVAEFDGCRVERQRTKVSGGIILDFTPVDCAPAATPGRQVVAIGDSHSGAYEILMQTAAGEQRVPVRIYQALGCRVFRFWDAPGSTPPRCQRFLDAALAETAASFGPEDVLFLPALRVPRFREPWGHAVNEDGPPGGTEPTPADFEDVERAAAQLAPLIERGVEIVVAGPTPIFRSAPFRCADPFTVGNPHCSPESGPGLSTDRAQLETRRQRAMAGIESFVALYDGASLWDPFPLLCPGEVCEAFRGDEPLYVDGDHLAPAANRLLAPSFLAHLDALSPRQQLTARGDD